MHNCNNGDENDIWFDTLGDWYNTSEVRSVFSFRSLVLYVQSLLYSYFKKHNDIHVYTCTFYWFTFYIWLLPVFTFKFVYTFDNKYISKMGLTHMLIRFALAKRVSIIASVYSLKLSYCQGQKYMCGDDMTIVDISMATNIALLELRNYKLDTWPLMSQWFQRMKSLPYWAECNQGLYEWRSPMLSDWTLYVHTGRIIDNNTHVHIDWVV